MLTLIKKFRGVIAILLLVVVVIVAFSFVNRARRAMIDRAQAAQLEAVSAQTAVPAPSVTSGRPSSSTSAGARPLVVLTKSQCRQTCRGQCGRRCMRKGKTDGRCGGSNACWRDCKQNVCNYPDDGGE